MDAIRRDLPAGKPNVFAYGALLIGLVPQGLAEAAITAALPDIARDFGMNGELVAMMTLGTGALGLVFGALLSGRILQWFGTRRTYVAALVIYGLFGSAGAFVASPPLLFATRVVVGFAASCAATAALWGISADFSGDRRARMFAANGGVGAVAILACIVLGGFLSQRFGWRSCFLQYPVFALMALPVALAGTVQRVPQRRTATSKNYFGALWPTYAVVVALFAVIGMVSMQLPFMLEDNGLDSAGARSLVQSLPGIAAIAGASSYGFLQSRIGPGRALSMALGCLVTGLLLLSTARGLTLPAIGAIGVGICMGLSQPYFYDLISRRTDVSSTQNYIGYLNAFTFFGSFVNAPIFQTMKQVIGLQGIFVVGALIAAILAAIVLRGAFAVDPARDGVAQT